MRVDLLNTFVEIVVGVVAAVSRIAAECPESAVLECDVTGQTATEPGDRDSDGIGTIVLSLIKKKRNTSILLAKWCWKKTLLIKEGNNAYVE